MKKKTIKTLKELEKTIRKMQIDLLKEDCKAINHLFPDREKSEGHGWLYVSQRYGVEQKTSFESFRGCVTVGCYDIDYNEAYPVAIYHKDELVWHHTMDFSLLDVGDFFVDYTHSEKGGNS